MDQSMFDMQLSSSLRRAMISAVRRVLVRATVVQTVVFLCES